MMHPPTDPTRVLPPRDSAQYPVEPEPVDFDDRPLVEDVERYEVLGTLAQGGMGEILLAKDTRIARHVALKVLKSDIRDEDEFRTRFLTEARLQGQLEHPSIVPVHDLGVRATGELYFSMKWVRGVTLREAMLDANKSDQPARFSRRRLLTAFSSVCLAIEFAHSRGVVHRDLKPSNIMLGDFGEVYVLDWGIAKIVHAPDTPLTHALEIPTRPHTTRVGMVLGTPDFMAPEHRLHNVVDRRTDVYALGIILDQLLLDYDIAPELQKIVQAATAKDPEKRIATARELHDRLEAYLDGDRDLELRRKLSEHHAALAESALAEADPDARSRAGRDSGRALGLDPSNERAMRTLRRLLTDVPAELPAAARSEAERAWQTRRARTLRMSTLVAASILLYAPFILWMGVRDWGLFGLWLALSVAAPITQFIAARDERTLTLALALICNIAGAIVLTTSMGLAGYIPAALTLVSVGWRVMIRRWYQAVILYAGLALAICAPFLLPALGLTSAGYSIHDDMLVLTPELHHFPPTATVAALIAGTVGVAAAGLVFGRMYATAIRRAEERLTFHAWQLAAASGAAGLGIRLADLNGADTGGSTAR
jgi:tRNA A-37 threonylcarbamoyl transferase component Bud32